MLLLPFLLVGCGLGSTSEQNTSQDVAVAPVEDSSGGEGVFKKGASSASEQPDATQADTPATAETVSTPPENPVNANEEPTAFTDITDLPAKETISTLNQLQVFDSTGSQFRPYDPITRGEYITWMYKANNAIRRDTEHLRPAPTFDPEFTDIDANHPAYKYVQAFANAGYAVGYDDKTFKPDQQITREEMIALKVGLDTGQDHKPYKNIRYLGFSDIDQIDEKYTGYIWQDRVNKNGARAFGTVKNLKPKQVVKRHEAAATLSKIKHSHADRALEKKIREDNQG